MPAALKANPESENWMDVSGAADGRQEHLEPPMAFQQSRRVLVCCVIIGAEADPGSGDGL